MRFNQQSWKLYREVIYVDPFKKIYIFLLSTSLLNILATNQSLFNQFYYQTPCMLCKCLQNEQRCISGTDSNQGM